LELSRSGRALVAMREDPVLASSVGVQTSMHRLFAFVVSAVIAGIAGICYAAYFRFISPEFFAFPTLIAMIVQVVIGGRGHRFAPFVGAFVYIGLVEWLHFGGVYSGGFFGVALIVIVIFAPHGVLGTAAKLLRRWGERAPAGGRTGAPPAVGGVATAPAETGEMVRP
jgi:branched-chain amino acid transport system permease protein